MKFFSAKCPFFTGIVLSWQRVRKLYMMSTRLTVREEHGHCYAKHNQTIYHLHCQLFRQRSAVTDTVQNAHHGGGTLPLVEDLLPTRSPTRQRKRMVVSRRQLTCRLAVEPWRIGSVLARLWWHIVNEHASWRCCWRVHLLTACWRWSNGRGAFVALFAWIKIQAIRLFRTRVYERVVDCSEVVYERSCTRRDRSGLIYIT